MFYYSLTFVNSWPETIKLHTKQNYYYIIVSQIYVSSSVTILSQKGYILTRFSIVLIII